MNANKCMACCAEVIYGPGVKGGGGDVHKSTHKRTRHVICESE